MNRLRITHESGPPSRQHDGMTELCRFRFGGPENQPELEGIFRVPTQPLGRTPADEVWYCSGRVTRGVSNGVTFAQCDGLVLTNLTIPSTAVRSVRDLTEASYGRLITVSRELHCPHLLRTWNFVPGINTGEGDNECYKRFSLGRGAAFDRFRIHEPDMPAGTAVGTEPESPMVITVLSTREPLRSIENPRQTSAYRYPRRHGPRSPSFSRAMIIGPAGGRHLIMSGTASIVGSESMHARRVAEQTAETLRNIRTLVQYGGGELTDSVKIRGQFRVYLRRQSDLELARRSLERELCTESQVQFLRSDICRRELDIEIEGVVPLQ